jgi:hypothetical protein
MNGEDAAVVCNPPESIYCGKKSCPTCHGELGDGEPSPPPDENGVLNVFAEVMEMAPVRHTLGVNHLYESGCTCLRCRADNAIERATDGGKNV